MDKETNCVFSYTYQVIAYRVLGSTRDPVWLGNWALMCPRMDRASSQPRVEVDVMSWLASLLSPKMKNMVSPQYFGGPVDLGSEKAMAPHSSTLAWKIPWAEEPGRLQSMGSLRVGHNWATSLSLFRNFYALEKEMATHSSVLAWRIPGMGEPGGLLSMGSHRVGHDWSDLAVAVVSSCLLPII